VVPELASREHLRAIVPVVRLALERAGKTWDELAAVAVTAGPGLVGSLLVGMTYAKALCFARRLPLIGVNHLEGHIHAVVLEARRQGRCIELTPPWRWWSAAGTLICSSSTRDHATA
jgi:N6-L-threonylcarbamoyladenine synthase